LTPEPVGLSSGFGSRDENQRRRGAEAHGARVLAAAFGYLALAARLAALVEPDAEAGGGDELLRPVLFVCPEVEHPFRLIDPLYDQHGYETIPRNSIKRILPSHITDDVPIYCFRLSRRGRFLGYRRCSIFYMIWIDPKHELYEG